MATEKELDGIYMSTYLKWLDALRIVRYETPEAYEVMAKNVGEYRVWVSKVSGINDLPEVPPK